MSMKQTLARATCPFGLKRMVRIYFIRHCFNPADLACEEALQDNVSPRRFISVDLSRVPVSDATTVLS